MDNVETGKVDAKGRVVFKDSKGRTHVKQGDKKVYVKKLFTPKRSSALLANTYMISPLRASSPMINTGKVDAKRRVVFKDSKGRTHVKQGDKKVYVKKLFTPKRSSALLANTYTISPLRVSSPMINTGKVDAKRRVVFKDSKGRTHVKQGDKKVYVKKLFTPQPPVTNIDDKVNVKKRKIFKVSNSNSKGRKNPSDKTVKMTISRVKLDCSTPAGLSQTLSTCWFNSSLNGFILAEATAKMIFYEIKLLSSSEIAALSKDFPINSCPITLSRKYVYHYFLKIHGGTPITGKENISVGLMNKLFTPKALTTPRAKGEEGAQPSEAAKRILAKVFNIGETGTLRDWETTCPNDFSNYTMLYREGFYYKRKQWLTPDMHPNVIQTADGKTKFNLSHIVYVVSWPKKGRIGYHAAVGYVCGGKRYLYDSNTDRHLELDWSKSRNRNKILTYSGATDFDYVSYTLYVRE